MDDAGKLPRRARRWIRRRAQRANARAVILTYHRVSDHAADPQLLCVRPERFGEHLAVLARYGNLATIGDLAGGFSGAQRKPPPLVLTFDDGYSDVLRQAHPALERHGIPATVYVTSGMVGSAREFWWDDLERIFLLPGHLPKVPTLEVGGEARRFELGADSEYPDAARERDQDWNVLLEGDPTARHHLYREVFALLKPLPAETRNRTISSLQDWAEVPETGRETYRILTEPELIDLSRAGGMTIGAHSETHAALSALPRESAAGEITRSKSQLEGVLGLPVDHFAYPFGGPDSVDPSTAELVASAGFRTACTTRPSPVRERDNLLLLPRLTVRDWDGKTFERFLRERVFW